MRETAKVSREIIHYLHVRTSGLSRHGVLLNVEGKSKISAASLVARQTAEKC